MPVDILVRCAGVARERQPLSFQKYNAHEGGRGNCRSVLNADVRGYLVWKTSETCQPLHKLLLFIIEYYLSLNDGAS